MPKRSSEETKSTILQTLCNILVENGFNTLDVASLAREARIDRALIYRYFGSMDGLLQKVAEKTAIWISTKEMVQKSYDSTRSMASNYTAFLTTIIDSLRAKPLAREVVKWELVEPNRLTRLLDFYRENQMLEVYKLLGLPLTEDQTCDRAAISAVLIGGIIYLAIKSKSSNTFGGVDISTDEGWERLKGAIADVVTTMDEKYRFDS
ncbi:TetR/AcrR family transcriptional regulator [Myxococcota bacterium]|nr:TetR/AcrR family transcriptional regulator [Myxococcota bacterium]MBU1533737.1 TetR/AcrR family transcriptional regulator [Myxococcota bacterium]